MATQKTRVKGITTRNLGVIGQLDKVMGFVHLKKDNEGRFVPAVGLPRTSTIYGTEDELLGELLDGIFAIICDCSM